MALPAFTLHVVDVFADTPLAGNPLAVIIADRLPDSELRQAIARETNLSETTFLGPCADPDGAWSVRIHTPSEELPFAGHPVLGTAWVIRERLLDDRPRALLLRTGKGPVAVGFEGDGADALVWLQAPEAEFEDLPVAELEGLVDDAFLSGPLPGVVGHNGPTMMLVSAADAAALADPLTDLNALTALLRRTGRSGILMAAPLGSEGEQPGWEVRVFFLAGTLREDPATGSAAALFGDVLRHNGQTGACVLRQGVAMQRPSRLYLRIPDQGPIAVGGQVQPVWSGRNG